MEDEIRKTAVSDIGVYYFSAEKQHMIVDRFEKECSCWTKAGGNPPPAKKAYAFSPCLLHPRTTPRPIPSAHRALAHPHRELSKATPRQSNLFFFFPDIPGFPV